MDKPTIVAFINEIAEIDNELKRIQQHARKIRQRKKNLEERIQSYLDETNVPGFRYENTTVSLERKNYRKSRNNNEKQKILRELLHERGINDETLISNILEKTKGQTCESNKLKISRK